MVANKEIVMGFGHRMYKNGDPRSPIMRDLARKMSTDVRGGDPQLLAIAESIEAKLLREKKMYPNVDFYAAVVYKMCGIPTELFTPLFVMARTSGWVAHAIEQRAANRLIRPTSIYVGPPSRKYIPKNARTEESKL
eukprot:GHVT01035348.1.p1 GENE.GHVT01035348.1~~GHVT01035348.1.p1  ORF type:complete len:136 (-),score=9.28 GHVT01035348.1:899-1306(-)